MLLGGQVGFLGVHQKVAAQCRVVGGQVGFLGGLQKKVAAQCRVVKTFDSAQGASRRELGRIWSWGPEGRDKFNLGVHICSL